MKIFHLAEDGLLAVFSYEKREREKQREGGMERSLCLLKGH